MSQSVKKVTQNTTPSKAPSVAGSTSSSVAEKDPLKAVRDLELKTKAV